MQAKKFYPFLTAKTFMALSDVLYIMTIVTYIFNETGSAAYAAIYPVFQITASILAGFTTPLLVERFSFKRLVPVLCAIKVFCLLILTVVFPYITPNMVLLLLFILPIALASGWAAPLMNTMVPKLVSKDFLVKANSYLTFSNHSIQLAGYSFTGILVVTYGEIATLTVTTLLQAAAFVFIAWTAKFIKEEHKAVGVKSKWASSKEGWVLLWNNKHVRLITIMDTIEGIAGTIWVGAITLVFVKDALNQGAEWWGFINSSYYVGTLIGGLFALFIAKKVQQHLILSMAIGSFLFSILTFLYGVNSIPWVALLLCVLMGPAYQLRDIAQQTAVQTSADINVLPKIYAARGILLSSISGLSVLLIGIVADVLGIRMVYILGAALICLSAVISFTLVLQQRKQIYNQSA